VKLPLQDHIDKHNDKKNTTIRTKYFLRTKSNIIKSLTSLLNIVEKQGNLFIRTQDANFHNVNKISVIL